MEMYLGTLTSVHFDFRDHAAKRGAQTDHQHHRPEQLQAEQREDFRRAQLLSRQQPHRRVTDALERQEQQYFRDRGREPARGIKAPLQIRTTYSLASLMPHTASVRTAMRPVSMSRCSRMVNEPTRLNAN